MQSGNNGGVTAKDNQSKTAYLSATSKQYHSRPDYGEMNLNKLTKTTVSEAEKEGYGHCSKC